MRLLLDTHVFLWAVAGSPLLKAATRQMLQAADEPSAPHMRPASRCWSRTTTIPSTAC